MENVLDLYAKFTTRSVRWCALTDCPYQLLAERRPLPIEPGKPKRQDYEYEPGSHLSLFIGRPPNRSAPRKRQRAPHRPGLRRRLQQRGSLP